MHRGCTVEERPFRAALIAALMKGFSPGVRVSPAAIEERRPAILRSNGIGPAIVLICSREAGPVRVNMVGLRFRFTIV
jgi:hypothetical protein